MKNFKQYLKEFKINTQPQSNSDGDDPVDQVTNFMKNTSFSLPLRNGTLRFDDSSEAAHAFNRHLLQHEEGHAHSVREQDEPMSKYFGKSATSHENALDTLTNYIQNHEDLPEHLRPYVQTAMDKIAFKTDAEHTERKRSLHGHFDFFGRPLSNIGPRIARSHKQTPIEIAGDVRHPYEDNQEHHFKDIISEMDSSDPDIPPTIRGQYIPR